MFDANIKIIDELKSFVHLVVNTPECLSRFRRSDKDFTRARKLPFERLVLMIIKLCKKTLSLELEKFFEEMEESFFCSVSAFTQQRAKLEPLFFDWWNNVLSSSFYFYYGAEVKRWKGYRVIGADGSSIQLINTPELSNYFGGQINQMGCFTLAKTFYHYDVLNELILTASIRPYRYGEVPMAYDAIGEIEEDMLMIYDRNFANYKMMALHQWQEKERKFIIRARETQNIIRGFIESNQSSSVVLVSPGASAIKGLKTSGFIVNKNTLLKVRLVRVDLESGIEVLMTNLWEEEGYAANEFKAMYFMRWGVETNIALQKNTFQMESFSGMSIKAVQQDFYATIFTANLHAILIKDAQKTTDKTNTGRKYPMKINKNKSIGRLKSKLVFLFWNKQPELILQQLHDYFIRDTIPIRNGRSFKRIRKNYAKAKHRTFTNYKPAF